MMESLGTLLVTYRYIPKCVMDSFIERTSEDVSNPALVVVEHFGCPLFLALVLCAS